MAEGSKVAPGAELAEIRATIADTESLRGSWPESRVETMLASLRAKEAELLSAMLVGDGAIAQAAPGGTSVAAGKDGLAIGRDLILQTVSESGGRPSPEALEQAYLHHLLGELSCVSLAGIDPAVPSSDPQEKLQLEAVYTALLTQTPRTAKPEERKERRSQLSALEVLDQHPRLVLLGDPGGGKRRARSRAS